MTLYLIQLLYRNILYNHTVNKGYRLPLST
nr:MAG TPA: hypothetical protein [Caudoviricetes sp.]